MRIVFMGTPDFAVPCLRSLAKKYEVVGVFTQPDKPKGRGKSEEVWCDKSHLIGRQKN